MCRARLLGAVTQPHLEPVLGDRDQVVDGCPVPVPGSVVLRGITWGVPTGPRERKQCAHLYDRDDGDGDGQDYAHVHPGSHPLAVVPEVVAVDGLCAKGGAVSVVDPESPRGAPTWVVQHVVVVLPGLVVLEDLSRGVNVLGLHLRLVRLPRPKKWSLYFRPMTSQKSHTTVAGREPNMAAAVDVTDAHSAEGSSLA